MKFNKNIATVTKTTNLAGGEAFIESPELELVSILLTSFVQDQFYRSASDTLTKVKQLLTQVDPIFAAQAAVYARTQFGMRSISHVVAGELCKRVSGVEWMKDFLNAVVYRPDDILEICAYYDTRANKETHAMRKGFGRALSRFDAYQLAKYQGKTKALSMVDVVNIFHPRSTPQLKQLVAGTLKNTETWEAKLSEAGKAGSKEEVEELKSTAWSDLLKANKLGYLALLRNLRNIAQQADDDTLTLALTQLVDESAIRKAMVFPFQFMTAAGEMINMQDEFTAGKNRKIQEALSKAINISVQNCPEFEGRTLIALDCSGSMIGRPWDIGSLFAAALYKKNDADLLMFSDTAEMYAFDPLETVGGLIRAMSQKFKNAGTNFHSIFEKIGKRSYDRIIILSDMQGWMSSGMYFYGRTGGSPNQAFAGYCRSIGKTPHVFSFDLQGYGTLQFPENNVYAIAGFSDKVFDLMKMLESDKKALLKEIRNVKFDIARRPKIKKG